MQTKLKKSLSILLTLVMLLGLLPTMALAAEPESYPIYLGSTQVTSANMGNILNDEGTVTASYDPATTTLTLNDYNGDYIYATQALIIHLADNTTNKISVPEETNRKGLHTNGECKLTGSGDLEITINSDNDGIYVLESEYDMGDGKLLIEMSGKLTINAKGDGLYADNNITINGGGDVEITAGNDGINVWNGNCNLNSSGSMTVEAGACGIYATGDGSIYIGGSGDLSVESHNEGIYSADEIKISGTGSVSATSTHKHAVSGSKAGPAVTLNETNPSVTFKTEADGKQAVYNENVSGSLVGGTKIDNYNVTDAPDGKSVVYTLAYPIYVGGTQVTSANQDNILNNEGTATASYDPATTTLTLNDYDGDYIYAEQALTIKLADGTTNTINVPESVSKIGIETKGALKLTGGGDLSVRVNAIYFDGIHVDCTTEDAHLPELHK